MMKIFLRTIYVFLMVLIGISVYQKAVNDRLNNLYNNDIKTNLISGNDDEYLDGMMVLTDVEKYLKDPIISFVSTDEDFSFTLDIYHIEKEIKGSTYYGIFPFINNFKSTQYKNVLLDTNQFVENNNLVGIELRINTTISNTFVINPLSPQYLSDSTLDNVNAKGGIFEPLFMEKENNSNDFKWFQGDVNYLSFNEITSFELSLLDGTVDLTKPKKTVFAKIDVSNEPKFGETINFNKNETGLLVAEGLGSVKSSYAQFNVHYEDNNSELIKHTNFNVLNEYNSLITRSMIIYVVLALIATFLIFFLKPLMRKIEFNKTKK